MQKSSIEKLGYWIHILLIPLQKVSDALMGARAIYNIPGRANSDLLVNNGSGSPAINGVNRKVMLNISDDEKLKVNPEILISHLNFLFPGFL